MATEGIDSAALHDRGGVIVRMRRGFPCPLSCRQLPGRRCMQLPEEDRNAPDSQRGRQPTPTFASDSPGTWLEFSAPPTSRATRPPVASISSQSVIRISQASGRSDTRCSSRSLRRSRSIQSPRGMPPCRIQRAAAARERCVSGVPTSIENAESTEGEAWKVVSLS